jgi:putative nucleotidyltransferase with HDIG domain
MNAPCRKEDILSTIQALQALSKQTKAEVYLVGGFVRDLLRNKNNTDFDVVVRNLPMNTIESFLKKYGKVKRVNMSVVNDLFGVSIMLFRAFNDDMEAQISLPRRGKLQIPATHNTLQQDARFRDFRLNAMYLPICYKNRNEVIDNVGGKSDIKKRIIRANGSPKERIKESPIRMMRAISLAARTNYRIHPQLMEAITENASLIENAPAEAVRSEFDKVLLSKRPSKYLKLMLKVGLLKYVAPELNDCVNVGQDTQYHKYDVFTHLIYATDNSERDLVLRLAALLHDIGKPSTRKEYKRNSRVTFHKHEVISVRLTKTFLKRLRYPNDISRQVLHLVKYHMFHYTRDWTDAAVRKFIRKAGITEEYMTEKMISKFPLFKLRAAERLGNGLKSEAVTDRQRDFEARILEVYNESKALEIKDLDINGTVIMEIFNIRPGIEVGNILKHLLEQVLETPNLNNRRDLLKLTTEYLHQRREEEKNGGPLHDMRRGDREGSNLRGLPRNKQRKALS